ncbi:MAG: choice-of-anchor Q domain-containing protein [Dokdonella sp.]|uniref:choice-of-anchor Q domain-containing protein n=1 Tax=Dokdonella sp. TaxID=2291710 RepID=UPI0032671562
MRIHGSVSRAPAAIFRHRVRVRPLAACLVAALSGSVSSAFAAAPTKAPRAPQSTILVENCNNTGPGSLRNAVFIATSGDTIDATHLTCSTITLTSGAIATTLNQLTIAGPGMQRLTVDGDSAHRVFLHVPTNPSNSGLTVSGMTIANGRHNYQAGIAKGGCVYSSHFVTLSRVTVRNCVAASPTGAASYGGGVYATGISLLGSTVSGNRAEGTNGRGGGVFSRAGLGVRYSTIKDNTASYVAGGGSSDRGIEMYHSTVSNNRSGSFVGGLAVFGGTGSVINDSTISGNSALTAVGGLQVVSVGGLHVGNSTIAFNHLDSPNAGNGAGIFIRATTFNLTSSIVWGNTSGAGTANDIDGDSGGTLTGNKNLIAASSLGFPPNTLIGFNPLLKPLAFNGGPTATHALSAGSPAIDAGVLNLPADGDQRGAGYARKVGPQQDMGAYEFDPERIFRDGFDRAT